MNKLSRDLFFSTGFSVLNVLFNFWLIREAEYLFTAASLSVFMLFRRVGPTFTNLSQLGTSQALIRYGSIHINDKTRIKTYFFISFIGWLLSTLLMTCIYFLFGEELELLIYNNQKSKEVYMLYTFWYVSILHLSYLVQPYFLTQRKIIVYNIINMLNASVIMIVVFMFLGPSPKLIAFFRHSLFAMSLLQISLMLFIVVELKMHKLPSLKMIKDYGKEFYLYGMPRSIITFSDMLLLTIGSLLVVNGEAKIASFLIALTLARVVMIVLQPVSKLSSVVIGNNNTKAKEKRAINIMTGAILYSTSLLVIILYNWIDVVLEFWLSNKEIIGDVKSVFQILALGLIPYSIFYGLKGIVEIKFYKPYNLYTLTIAILVHALFFYIFGELNYSILQSLSFSLLFSFLIMGGLTIIWCRKYFIKPKYFRFDILLLIVVVLFTANHYASLTYDSIFICILSSFISVIVYITALYYFNIDFVKDTMQIFSKKKKGV
ncbi:hypothetical protein [Flagellimonas pacifica]|uniref:Na+-driven multidrug efflux pump n=1 Tax=Flagellimonas pacifica TaxID=1247520 RepID=A0A285MCW9_9FLAO|nr:hypothetical protein [Allomuricauda parva]SNY95025.1 Na+-driven multidrug efflux pump [Allomuricauda parva]